MINCLTYEQLHAYSTHTVQKVEREHLYMHIASCELCACAVNGFTVLPFSTTELTAIHQQIDERTNATAHPLTLAQVFIVLFSFLSIASVYLFSNNISVEQPTINTDYPRTELTILIPEKNETKSTSAQEISAATKTFKKIINVMEYKKFERNITPIEQLELIKPISIVNENEILENDDNVIAPHFNANAIYIYDLKVSDYSGLYFSHTQNEKNLFGSHTNVTRENEKTAEDEFGPEQHVFSANKILKQGLASFNKQEYENAVADFNLLLENNPQDVNAQFYSALAYYNLNKIPKCINCLNDVLKNSNDNFYPEAQWYLALVTLKTGDKETAKTQLETIVKEKGFYSPKAKEKLKML